MTVAIFGEKFKEPVTSPSKVRRNENAQLEIKVEPFDSNVESKAINDSNLDLTMVEVRLPHRFKARSKLGS